MQEPISSQVCEPRWGRCIKSAAVDSAADQSVMKQARGHTSFVVMAQAAAV